MKKTTRSILSLCLAVIMIAAMATTAFAEQTKFNEKTTVTADDDTTKVTLTKYYELLGDTTNGESPNEEFVVTIEPYKVENAPVGFEVTDLPIIGDEVEDEDKIGTATLEGYVSGEHSTKTTVNGVEHFIYKLTTDIDIPDVGENGFPEVGDFYYKVTEDAGKTAGVTYDPSVYIMHVQVVRVNNKSIRLVTLHTTTKNADNTLTMHASKTDHIENKYSNGDLIIKKTVSGNSGEQEKYFGILVTFTAPTGKTVLSDIVVADGNGLVLESEDNPKKDPEDSDLEVLEKVEADDDGWTGSKTVVVYLKHGDSVTFSNLPKDMTYKVQELSYAEAGYAAPTYALDKEAGAEEGDDIKGSEWEKYVEGKISDLEDTVSITNSKDTTIDIGVVLEDAPFVMLIVVSVAALGAFLVIRRKREI